MQEERDDIEKFFANRLGEKDFPFEEEQWEILAKKLDDASPVKPPFWLRFRKGIGYILIPIITFLIGWYLQSGTKELSPDGAKPVATPSELPSKRAEPEPNEPAGITEPSIQTREEFTEEPQVNDSGNEATADLVVLREVLKNEQSVSASLAAKNAASTKKEVPPIGSRHAAYFPVAPLNLLELDFLFSELDLSLEVAVGDSILAEEEVFEPEWSITLVAAPDFNSTNFGDLYNSLGESVGIQLNRRFKEKTQFSFGLLLNNKVYSAGKGEYAPAHAYWTRGIEPDLTDAKCLVLEIPISLGMRLFKTNRGALWGNVGVSSYVFLTERYEYYYLNNNDPDLNPGWEGKNENKHVAAVLGFSLMYAHRLSERSSLIFEPYFKSTIQPVGHGNVDLLSSGLNVGFNYRLFPKN